MKETYTEDRCDTCQRKFRVRERYYTVSMQHIDMSGLEVLDERLYNACKKCWETTSLGKSLKLRS